MQREDRFGVSHLTVISSAYKLVLAATFAGFIGTVLETACVGKDVVLDAVDIEPTPGLLALQKGGLVLSKSISCYRGPPPPSPPRVSALMAKDKIWIGLSFGDIREFPYQHDPQDRLWKIHNVVGGYDWPAARESLLEVREILTYKSPEVEFSERG